MSEVVEQGSEQVATLQRDLAALRADHTTLRADHTTLRAELDEARASNDRLRDAYRRALEELALLKRRMFVGTAERKVSAEDQLSFESMMATVRTLSARLQQAEDPLASDESSPSRPPQSASSEDEGSSSGASGGRGDGPKDPRRGGGGRRDLSESKLPLVRVELRDEELEKTAEFVAFETSWKIGYERGGARRIQIDRAIYKTREAGQSAEEPAEFETVSPPKEIVRRGLLAPSMIARVLTQKYLMGLPFHRQEQQFAVEGCPLDRGTMSRYAEEIGATLGAIVLAMREDAMRNAFCLSTDATGVSIQLGALAGRERGPCRKGHFFVVLADQEHVFFEYQAKQTSAAVCEMFRGYRGYVQADAHAVYDALFRGEANDEGPAPREVGCWSHARRKFWEAAVCKHAQGVEGLRRIDAIFAADRALSDLAPAQRSRRRAVLVRPLVDAFVAWCVEGRRESTERGSMTRALGYVVRHEQALRRFLEDGRLVLTNNAAERALRSVAVGRKNWLFCGSDDHASATANLFSLVASCRLHGLDAETYLREVIHVLPYWPHGRLLELSPRDWLRTRGRLRGEVLERGIGAIEVPPAEEQQ